MSVMYPSNVHLLQFSVLSSVFVLSYVCNVSFKCTFPSVLGSVLCVLCVMSVMYFVLMSYSLLIVLFSIEKLDIIVFFISY